MANEKLKAGDKYLSIKIVGHDYVTAFKNNDKKNPKEPDYKGDGVAIWISTKKEDSKPKYSEQDIF